MVRHELAISSHSFAVSSFRSIFWFRTRLKNARSFESAMFRPPSRRTHCVAGMWARPTPQMASTTESENAATGVSSQFLKTCFSRDTHVQHQLQSVPPARPRPCATGKCVEDRDADTFAKKVSMASRVLEL